MWPVYKPSEHRKTLKVFKMTNVISSQKYTKMFCNYWQQMRLEILIIDSNFLKSISCQ
jgi:hypothetical protein